MQGKEERDEVVHHINVVLPRRDPPWPPATLPLTPEGRGPRVAQRQHSARAFGNPDQPKSIPDSTTLSETSLEPRIGAPTRLSDTAVSPIVNQLQQLAQAASRVATLHVREMGTIEAHSAAASLLVFPETENRFHPEGRRQMLRHDGDN